MDAASFANLISQVDQSAASDDPLDRIDAALVIAGTIHGQADALVDHVVGQARAAGRSWTEIGTRVGISKQAARKRFAVDVGAAAVTPVLPPNVSLQSRLRDCLARADELAEAGGAAQVGPEHVLAGLLTDGVAATILDKLGVTTEAITAASARLFGPSDPPTDLAPTLSAEVVCAIEAAAHLAQVRAENPKQVTVGTEHMLAVLALDHGSRAHRVLLDLGVDIAVVKKELACYVTVNPHRTRRLGRARRPSTATCSFCGTTETADRPLAHGPNVNICSVCTQRAAENLATRSST